MRDIWYGRYLNPRGSGNFLAIRDLGARKFGGHYWSLWKLPMFGERALDICLDMGDKQT